MNTEMLVKKAKSGDDNAFYELIQTKKETLYRTAYAYVKNKEDALDIVSDTVYKAYVSIKKLKEPSFFNTWLTRILINSALDHIKKSSRIIPMEEAAMDNHRALEDNKEEKIDLYRAVDSLDEKCKTVVILKYFQDLTITQISDIMQCPMGTVKTYLHRALKGLRIELKEDFQNA